jgi:transglutaminase-like putative cysteine protease
MKIRAGYEISYECSQPTPMILTLSVHPSRFPDLLTIDRLQLDPPIPFNTYHDSFGNFCHVNRAPEGQVSMSTDFLFHDNGEPDATAPEAVQHPLEQLPVDVLIYLLGSRYCETDRLSNTAWSLFGQLPKGWPLVRAICDYVHDRIAFGYHHASSTKTAWDAHNEGRGVCRDFAHLAITLCRCMNIPARYCTGYLGTLVCRPTHLRWISARGLRSTSAIAGTLWMLAITNRGSAVSSWRVDATRQTLRSSPLSDRARSRNSRYSLPRSRERLSPVRPLRDCLKLGTSG